MNGLSVVEDGQPFADSVSNVLPMAREYKLSAYDAAYLDVAVRHEIPLATLDDALQKACIRAGIKMFRV
jgi:predicted nucleic acid-binding protein